MYIGVTVVVLYSNYVIIGSICNGVDECLYVCSSQELNLRLGIINRFLN